MSGLLSDRRPRALVRAAALAAVALLVLAAAGSPALAANPKGGGKPTSGASATASASVSGSTASLTASVNRPSGDVSRVSCLVAGQDVGCSLTSTSRKGGASYSATKAGLAVGSYSFDVTFTLTDGSTASAATSFAVASAGTPAVGEKAACDALGGTFSGVSNQWQCTYPAAAASSVPAPSLMAECVGLVMYTVGMSGKVAMVSFGCAE